MKYFKYIFFAIILFTLHGPTFAQDTVEELCADKEIREKCNTSCAKACGNETFLIGFAGYCLSSSFSVSKKPKKDDASCSEIFVALEGASPIQRGEDEHFTSGGDEASESKKVPAECDKVVPRSAQRKCELSKVFPACSSNVVELEGRARLMVRDIGLELEKYGSIFDRDWTNVTNRDELCDFELEQLDESYKTASESPSFLRSLQRQASEIQSCQAEWEAFSRENIGRKASDQLVNNVARDLEKQLVPLKEQNAILGQSIAKLQSATEVIDAIIDTHIIYCSTEALPRQ